MTLLERKTATLESITKTARTKRQKLKSLLKIQAEQRNSLFKKGIKSNLYDKIYSIRKKNKLGREYDRALSE